MFPNNDTFKACSQLGWVDLAKNGLLYESFTPPKKLHYKTIQTSAINQIIN